MERGSFSSADEPFYWAAGLVSIGVTIVLTVVEMLCHAKEVMQMNRFIAAAFVLALVSGAAWSQSTMTLTCSDGNFTGSVATGIACAPALPAGFYVAANGSDSSAGTLAAPFLTLTKARDAMRASGTIKTTYIRAGTYTPASTGTGCGDTKGIALILSAPDNGQTWSYYPPDGYGSAIINGQAVGSAGLGWGVCARGADNLTINGLKFQNFQVSGIDVAGASQIIKNNTVNNITNTLRATYGIGTNNAPNGQIVHNVVSNIAGMGIGSWPTSAGGVNNLLIAYNYITNACSSVADCGGIYIENKLGTPNTGEKVKYNYVTNINGAGGGEPIYIDDESSAVEITGNVMAGSNWQCYFVHGGDGNLATGNICDLGANNSMGPVSAQWVSGTMTGNTWKNNIILAGITGSAVGSGYNCNTGPCQMTIGPNAYFNYVGTGVKATGSLGTEIAYTYQNPNFTCGWTYTLPSNSPVYNSPVNFPAQPADWGAAGFWGPPGFTIPRTGILPSPPHAC